MNKKRSNMKNRNEEQPSGYQCIWSNLNEHPKCPHGPTLLFGKCVDGKYQKFYACSACRDRKLCSFYLEYDKKLTKQQKQIWEIQTKKVLPRYNHSKMFIRLNEMLAENSSRRIYCHDCEQLSFVTEIHKHRNHDVSENLSDQQLSRPTELLKPLENSKKEAQFLFSQKSVKDIVDMLVSVGAKNVLSIGTPRIHEYITNNLDGKVSSLLLDFDGRFHNFFGPLSYCWYNLFNHHFFDEDAHQVFKDFLTQNGGKDTYVICDPPFGGRVEPMSQTMKTISDSHAKWNEINAESDQLKIMFILPHFMEPILKVKSNPPGISGGLKELKMSDYKVEYDNHPLFAKSVERKIGSSVRIFTNIDLNLLVLPESDGYKYCKRCRKWTAEENKHCKICKECTSKDGRRYRHCKICGHCVKPTWKHCAKCQRCTLETHKCGIIPTITGQCHKCSEFGHIEKNCPMQLETISQENSENDGKSIAHKRKNQDKTDIATSKKSRIVVDKETVGKRNNKLKLKKAKLASVRDESAIIIQSEKMNDEAAVRSESELPDKKLKQRNKLVGKKSLKKKKLTSTESSENSSAIEAPELLDSRHENNRKLIDRKSIESKNMSKTSDTFENLKKRKKTEGNNFMQKKKKNKFSAGKINKKSLAMKGKKKTV